MFRFSYERPTTIADACAILAASSGKAKVIAGGTDLIIGLRDEDKKVAHVEKVVDITHIPALKYIKTDGEVIRVGALVTHDEIFNSPILKSAAPFFAEASNTVGSPQIRHSGTIGGSICNASPAADPVPPLLALDAEVTLISAKGKRVVKLATIYDRPYKPTIGADELLTEVSFSVPAGAKTAFVKLGRRKALAIARMNVAVLAVVKAGIVEDIRIVPGSVLPKTMRVEAAEAVLLGKKPTEELIAKASRKIAEVMLEMSGVRWSTPYKEPVIEALTRRALTKALEVE